MVTMLMKIRIYERSPLFLFFPRWVTAFVLGRRIFLRGLYRDAREATLRHEVIHACQYAEHGIFRFLWRYFWAERQTPYRQKAFEKEAYMHQNDPNYLSRRWPRLKIELQTPERAVNSES